MKTIIISLGLLAMAQNGYGLPAWDLAQKQLERKINRQSRPQAKSNSCTDFSGHWKGVCKYDETTLDSDVTFKQEGCESIQSSGESAQPLGALSTLTQARSEYSLGISHSSNWNASQTEILTHYNGLVKAADQVIPLQGTMDLKIQDGKLVSSVQILGINVACVYEKQ